MRSNTEERHSQVGYMIPATAKEGLPFFVEDHILMSSGKNLEDFIAKHREETGISTPVQIVRNARRHRWEVYLVEEEGANV